MLGVTHGHAQNPVGCFRSRCMAGASSCRFASGSCVLDLVRGRGKPQITVPRAAITAALRTK